MCPCPTDWQCDPAWAWSVAMASCGRLRTASSGFRPTECGSWCSCRARPAWARPRSWPKPPARPSIEGAYVLLGRCEEDLATPYQLFAEALSHFVRHAPEEQLIAYTDVYGSELPRLVPALGQRLPGLPRSAETDPDTERYLLFAAVVGLLSAMAQEQPVLLVLDDLQWADAGSLQLLRHLMASDQKMRLLVVGTYATTSCRVPIPSSTHLAHSVAWRVSRGSSCGGSTMPEWWRSSKERAVTPSTMRGWAWRRPSTERPMAARSS